MRKSCVVLSLLVFNILLGIGTARGDSPKDPCDSISPQDMQECALAGLDTEDKKLNNLYQQLRSKAGRGTKTEKALIKAQKAWLSYVEATCQYENIAYEGGGLYGPLAIACRTWLIKQRNIKLEGYLQCDSNDCP